MEHLNAASSQLSCPAHLAVFDLLPATPAAPTPPPPTSHLAAQRLTRHVGRSSVQHAAHPVPEGDPRVAGPRLLQRHPPGPPQAAAAAAGGRPGRSWSPAGSRDGPCSAGGRRGRGPGAQQRAPPLPPPPTARRRSSLVWFLRLQACNCAALGCQQKSTLHVVASKLPVRLHMRPRRLPTAPA